MVKLRVPTKADYFGSDGVSKQQMLSKVLKAFNAIASIVAGNIFSKDFTTIRPLFVWTVFIVVIGHIVLTIHNIYYYGDDLARFCFLMVTCMCPIQGLSMFQLFVFQRQKILILAERIEKLLQKYNTQRANEIFEKWILLGCHWGLSLGILFTFCAVLVIIYPVGFYILFGEKIRHFGFELPWVDWRTPIGYTLNFIYSGLIVGTFEFGLWCTVFLSVFFIIMSFAQFELSEVMFAELNDLIAGNKSGENEMGIKKVIAEITDNHNELIELLSNYEETFQFYFLFQIGCCVAQSTVTLFATTVASFYPGYVVLFIACFEIFIPCLTGTLLTVEGDNYHRNLCDINWHLLSLSDQKSYSLLMLFSLKPKTITMVVTQLDFHTFTEIYKSIYSYYMLLHNIKN